MPCRQCRKQLDKPNPLHVYVDIAAVILYCYVYLRRSPHILPAFQLLLILDVHIFIAGLSCKEEVHLSSAVLVVVVVAVVVHLMC